VKATVTPEGGEMNLESRKTGKQEKARRTLMPSTLGSVHFLFSKLETPSLRFRFALLSGHISRQACDMSELIYTPLTA
jgi:hypothetical protein